MAWLTGILERHPPVLFALFSVAFFASTAVRSTYKPFWHDEIYTILLTGLPSISTMWAAVRDGVDLAPPLNLLVTRGVRAVAGVGPIVTRLPPMLGFWLMTLVLFEMVRRRAGAVLALSGVLLSCYTAAYRYAYEARAYGLMLGLFALALFSWSEAAAGRRRAIYLPLLTTALAAGVWNHYFAVLAYLPVAAGEAVRTARARRADVRLWTAVVASMLAALPLRSLLARSASQASTFWMSASLADIGPAYRFLVEPLIATRFFVTGGVVAALLLVAFFRPSSGMRAPTRLPAHEVAAFLACLLVPFAGVLIGVFVTGVFVPRYVLPGAFGICLMVPLAAGAFGRRPGLAGLVLLAVIAYSYGESLVQMRAAPPYQDPVENRIQLVAALRTPGPTVVSSSLTYLQLWYYTAPALRGRLTYLADPHAARGRTGSDTIDRGYLALARWTPVSVQRYDTFIATHPEFRVYSAGSGWLMDELEATGARIELLGPDAGGRLYRVVVR